MFDLIGDIHGHAEQLTKLLAKLGYEKQQGMYAHPDRRVIFLGDFIDRGPQIREVLEIVRAMVQQGHALAVMGNHEWNALAYHTPDPENPSEFLRKHNDKNKHQHQATLDQLETPELESYLAWFRTLPLWLEIEGVRAVHACWDEAEQEVVKRAFDECGGLTEEFLLAGSRSGSPVFKAVEVLLKGKEIQLPEGVVYFDKEGSKRHRIRTRWYLSPEGMTYRNYALQVGEVDSDDPIPLLENSPVEAYASSAQPVFLGHYWLEADQPELLAQNVACLDYSVAKGGFLCGYRWSGEKELTSQNFVWTDRSPRR